MRRAAIVFIACCLAAAALADSTWNRVNPTPSAASFYGVAAGAGRLVVTGQYSSRTSFISSNSATNWTEVHLERGYAVGASAASYLIAYDPAWGFVAAPSALDGNGFSWIWSSPDGVDWDFGTTRGSYGNTLVASKGIFVSSGGINSVFSSKDGGQRWASIPLSSYSNTPSVIDQNFFIPVGKTEVYSSPDGINLNLYYNFTSSVVPSGLGDISSVAQLYGNPDGSIVALLATDHGGLVLRSNTVAHPSWKVTFKWDAYIGFGYFARASSSLFVSLPGGQEWNQWTYLISADNGKTWSAYQYEGLGFGPIVSAGDYLVMFGKAGKLVVSTDAGQSWIKHDNGITERIQNIWYSSNLNSLVLATEKAIYSAPDGNFTGANSVSRSNPKLIGLFEFGSGSNAYFGGVDQYGNVSVAPVAGGHWIVRKGPNVQIPRTRGYGATAVAYAEDQDIWVVAIQTFQPFSQLPVFYFSSGSSSEWTLGQSNLNIMDVASTNSLAYANKAFVALISQLGVFNIYTSSNGSLWTKNQLDIKVPLSFSANCELSVAGPRDGKQRFFILCSTSQVPPYFSNDGYSWKQLNIPQGAVYINYLEGSKLWLARGYDWFVTSADLTNWSDPFPNPFPSTLFDLAVENPSSGSIALVSTYDNSIVVTNSI